MLRYSLLLGCLLSTGCSVLPEIAHQPTFHNPFPQLSKVAVAPFFNLSEEATLNGSEVALAYYNELQSIPGFEVTPVGTVKAAMEAYNIDLTGPADARQLAQLLDVDVLVVGVVTDYDPYYPPRMGMKVLWYAANPSFHPIPPGYGLPWGTPEEEFIPAPLVFEAEMALAKEQLVTQTPPYERFVPEIDVPKPLQVTPEPEKEDEWQGPDWDEGVEPVQYVTQNGEPGDGSAGDGEVIGGGPAGGGVAEEFSPTNPGDLAQPGGVPPVGMPPNWPDARGFIPPPPRVGPPTAQATVEPVISHTRIYNGNDMEFTEALASYYYFRDEARFGGWQAYLQRSSDFIRFCCHMHIAETLSARGGVGETRVVWRWPTIR
ncbi:MAG: hypothetical protein V3R99_09370 [Thermoguttaceae bacterium]